MLWSVVSATCRTGATVWAEHDYIVSSSSTASGLSFGRSTLAPLSSATMGFRQQERPASFARCGLVVGVRRCAALDNSLAVAGRFAETGVFLPTGGARCLVWTRSLAPT